jgi:hypothetical protein
MDMRFIRATISMRVYGGKSIPDLTIVPSVLHW